MKINCFTASCSLDFLKPITVVEACSISYILQQLQTKNESTDVCFAYSHFKQFLLGRRRFFVRLLRFLLDRWRVGLQAKLWRLRQKIKSL